MGRLDRCGPAGIVCLSTGASRAAVHTAQWARLTTGISPALGLVPPIAACLPPALVATETSFLPRALGIGSAPAPRAAGRSQPLVPWCFSQREQTPSELLGRAREAALPAVTPSTLEPEGSCAVYVGLPCTPAMGAPCFNGATVSCPLSAPQPASARGARALLLCQGVRMEPSRCGFSPRPQAFVVLFWAWPAGQAAFAGGRVDKEPAPYDCSQEAGLASLPGQLLIPSTGSSFR